MDRRVVVYGGRRYWAELLACGRWAIKHRHDGMSCLGKICASKDEADWTLDMLEELTGC